MSRYHWQYLSAVLSCALLLSACVETEVKRTTKNIDASNVEISVTDASKPHLRLSLYGTSPEQNARTAALLQLEINDGESKYMLDGNAFVVEEGSAGAVTVAPWLNVPDTGQLSFKFALLDSDGVNIINDQFSLVLEPDQYVQVSLGIFDWDPCEASQQKDQCRDYTLPRALQDQENERFALLWAVYPIEGDTTGQ